MDIIQAHIHYPDPLATGIISGSIVQEGRLSQFCNKLWNK